MEDEVVLGSVRADADELAQDKEPEGAGCILSTALDTLCCVHSSVLRRSLHRSLTTCLISATKKRLSQDSLCFKNFAKAVSAPLFGKTETQARDWCFRPGEGHKP